jgi:hypothetical protein
LDRSDTLAALRRGDLGGARELRLPDGLAAVPPEVFALGDTLEVLDLGRGSLTDLPADLARLRRLKVLFCSGNPFPRLPPVLGDCPTLSQLGFRGCGIRDVPAESLPRDLRWLTLTDNRIEHLPDALGERPLLQKLMLAGNRIAALPDSLAAAENLELIRLACNRIETLPPWLTRLPRLAWIAYAGNPAEPPTAPADAPRVPWTELTVGDLLGEGASGRVHRATWRGEAVALKLFKGAMTSDGLPEREMEACLAAGMHPALTGALGRLDGHPDGAQGLLLRLLPPHWRVLAGPPSLASCSRDIYAPDLRLDSDKALRIARAVAQAVAHLHGRGLLHGDVYAHNTLWDSGTGAAVLSDFGAASALPDGEAGAALARIEVRALGLLLGELLDRCEAPSEQLRALEQACTQSDPGRRPRSDQVAAEIARLAA